MVQRDLRIRYKNSAIGFLWSFINPLITTAVMTVVFGGLLNRGVNNFSAYILAAYLPFMFFQMSILDSAQSVLVALPIVKKIYFPREILPLAAVISNFIHLMLGFVVFFLYLLQAYLRDPQSIPFQATTIYLPVLLLISFMISAGMSLIVSALNTFFEDVKYMVGILLYLMFFLCPVMYFMEEVAASNYVHQNPWIFKLYNLNPIASLSTAYRQCLLAPPNPGIPVSGGRIHTPLPIHWGWIAYDAVVGVVLLVVGYALFNRLKWKFVERP